MFENSDTYFLFFSRPGQVKVNGRLCCGGYMLYEAHENALGHVFLDVGRKT